MIGDDPLGAGDCGALLDNPALPILLDKTPWRVLSYPPRPTIAEVFAEHMPADMVVTLTQTRDGFDYLEDRSPDAHTAAERMHATMATITAAVHEIAHRI